MGPRQLAVPGRAGQHHGRRARRSQRPPRRCESAPERSGDAWQTSTGAEAPLLSLSDRLASGTFADIFVPAPGGKAYKVFRRIADPMLAHVAPHVFEAEVAAYRIATCTPALKRYVPEFFGTVAVSAVLDERGADVGAQYWLSLCYLMQLVREDPQERKFGSFFNPEEWHLMQPLEQLFEAAGIGHLGDASVLHWRGGAPVLIDFATSDAAADHARTGP